MSIVDQLNEAGIHLRSYGGGETLMICPQCSAARKKKTDKCLSVKIDEMGAVWHCFHCAWSGSVYERSNRPAAAKPKPAPVKPSFRPSEPTDKLAAWFAKRGISKATIEAMGVSHAQVWMPGCESGETVGVVAFPFRRKGEIVNVKYRTADKRFRQEKGAEKVFYNVEAVVGAKEVIIVEGEIDALSLIEAGLPNVISVPDGAPSQARDGEINPEDDAKFSYVWNCREELAAADRIILATDADGPGYALAEELVRRLGPARCWRVEWPNAGDAQRKDANEVLVIDGAQVLRECIAEAKPWPIRSLYGVDDYREAVFDLYRAGRSRACSTGWATVDPLMTIREGELSVVTGVPNSGKSEFIDAMMVNLAAAQGWRFAICSFENPVDEHLSKLAEKRLGKPFWPGPRERMSEFALDQALEWASDHFSFIRADDEAPTLDWVLESAAAAVMRYGIRGLVIDPWNEIEHRRPSNQNETEFVSLALGKIKRFAAARGVHVWLVAHPAKMARENGKIPVPTLYDISGSANFANKADLGVVVHRVAEAMPPKTEIHIRKCRFKSVGRIGSVTLEYEPPTGRYLDLPQLDQDEYQRHWRQEGE